MKKTTPRYLIGIDFGTTNCTMAYAPFSDETSDQVSIEQFPIAQLATAKTEEKLFSLPSFVFFPLPEELKSKIAALSWAEDRTFCVGKLARDRGSEVPSRLISSAKSWLCHTGIDRRKKLLPLTAAEEESFKMSPLAVCSEIMRHLKESWDEAFPKAPFKDQEVFVTVPASFDPGARQLISEAAQLANYPEIVLLEEPQAAFYAWLHKNHETWRKDLSVGDQILVIDIGGGTSDFSLISVADNNGHLELNRTAVGSHLLLGGDNIDLALAYVVRGKFEDKGHAIDDWQMQAIVYKCREAKESFLAENPPKEVDIAIMGRGSKLIGNSLKATITQQEVAHVITEGFMPLVAPEELSKPERHLGIQEIGLPYVQDPRLTCQLAKFLSQTGESDSNNIEKFIVPTAVLFNGGTMKSSELRNRMMAQLNMWSKSFGKNDVKELSGDDCDFAVSQGAVYYAAARRGKGLRIKSGTSRSYYIGVEEAIPAVPGIATPIRAVCVVPFGMEEGSEQHLESQEFALLLGETATFRFFSHSTEKLQDGTVPQMGTTIKQWKQELTELHPIEAKLPKEEGDAKTIGVKLLSKTTELGVLELWCQASDGRKWKLEFDIRK